MSFNPNRAYGRRQSRIETVASDMAISTKGIEKAKREINAGYAKFWERRNMNPPSTGMEHLIKQQVKTVNANA